MDQGRQYTNASKEQQRVETDPPDRCRAGLKSVGKAEQSVYPDKSGDSTTSCNEQGFFHDKISSDIVEIVNCIYLRRNQLLNVTLLESFEPLDKFFNFIFGREKSWRNGKSHLFTLLILKPSGVMITRFSTISSSLIKL